MLTSDGFSTLPNLKIDAENAERLRKMVLWGWTDTDIARILQVNPRTVQRWRDRLELPRSGEFDRSTHGTTSTYSRGCRCGECREANRLYKRDVRAKRRALTAANGGIAPTSIHGAATRGNWGCACDVCIEGKRIRNAKDHARRATDAHF